MSISDLYWPAHKGRDGCRTPMPWSPGANLGFSSGTPWLPAAPEHAGLTVEAQWADNGSTLNFTHALLRARKASTALRLGELAFLDLPAPLLGFDRTHDGERVRCVFNMSGEAVAGEAAGETLVQTGDIGGGQFGPYAARISAL